MSRVCWDAQNFTYNSEAVSLSLQTKMIVVLQPALYYVHSVWHWETINPYPANVIYLNFHPREVVSHYRDPQLQVDENYSFLFNLSTNIRKC